MSEITSVSISDRDEKYEVLKPAYDRFFIESVFRHIKCEQSEYATYAYEKKPSKNQYLAEEGIVEYEEKITKVYKYDIYRTDELTINFYERFVQEEDFIPNYGDVFTLTPTNSILTLDTAPDGYWQTTTMSFKLKTYNFFALNPTNAYIGIILKTSGKEFVFDKMLRGSGIVLGDVSNLVGGNSRKPSTQMSTWFKQINTDSTALAGYFDYRLITGTNTATPILKDGVEYTITVNVTSDSGYGNRKLWYTVQDSTSLYSSSIIDDPNLLTDWSKNDVGVFVNTSGDQTSAWNVKISEVEVTRS